MKRTVFYNCLSVCFFVVLFIGVVMLTDLLFNSSSSFFERMTDTPNIIKELGK